MSHALEALEALDDWFFDWLARHKRWNPGPGWNNYQAGSDDVFEPWVMAFARERVFESEAHHASQVMASEESRYPEHHLPRLLALIRVARSRQASSAGPSTAPSSADCDYRRRAGAAALDHWDRLDEEGRQAYRDEARRASAPGIHPKLVEALAQQIAAEDAGRVEWLDAKGPTLDGLLSIRRHSEGGPVSASSHLIPTRPNLGPAQEAIAQAQADASRNAQLNRLAKLQQTQPPKPAEPATPHPTKEAS